MTTWGRSNPANLEMPQLAKRGKAVKRFSVDVGANPTTHLIYAGAGAVLGSRLDWRWGKPNSLLLLKRLVDAGSSPTQRLSK